MVKKSLLVLITIFLFIYGCNNKNEAQKSSSINAKWFTLNSQYIKNGAHHTNHFKELSKFAPGFNKFVLKGIDKVQSSAMNGGEYFIGIKAVPTESPIGYNLSLFDTQLLEAPRTSSYCSGSSYSAFIEAYNEKYKGETPELADSVAEALRMQEPDGGRRNDDVKMWGKWNDDGFGNHFAMVQYAGIGEVIKPEDALPGDFMNISWKSGVGHSVVFLGWYVNENNEKCVAYWSSQKGTNGLGDQVVKLERIKEVMIVRVTEPEKLFDLQVSKSTNRKINGYKLNWK